MVLWWRTVPPWRRMASSRQCDQVRVLIVRQGEVVMSKLAKVVPLLGVLLFASGQAGAQTDYSKVEIKTTELGHRTYMLEGAGGNITMAVGEGGIVMVDGQFAPLHDKIKAAVAAV